MDKITVEIEGNGYEISNPENNFEVYSQALSKVLYDRIGAGKLIFDSCYLGGAEELVKIQNNVKLYSNICLWCASIVEIMEGEIKKNLPSTEQKQEKK